MAMSVYTSDTVIVCRWRDTVCPSPTVCFGFCLPQLNTRKTPAITLHNKNKSYWLFFFVRSLAGRSAGWLSGRLFCTQLNSIACRCFELDWVSESVCFVCFGRVDVEWPSAVCHLPAICNVLLFVWRFCFCFFFSLVLSCLFFSRWGQCLRTKSKRALIRNNKIMNEMFGSCVSVTVCFVCGMEHTVLIWSRKTKQHWVDVELMAFTYILPFHVVFFFSRRSAFCLQMKMKLFFRIGFRVVF